MHIYIYYKHIIICYYPRLHPNIQFQLVGAKIHSLRFYMVQPCSTIGEQSNPIRSTPMAHPRAVGQRQSSSSS